MEIAFLVVAVIGLLALTANASPSSTYVPAYPPPPPQPYSPSAAILGSPAMTPSTTANLPSTQLFSGAAQIGTSVSQQAINTIGMSPLAGAAIGGGIAAVAAIGTALWQAHEARLHGAQNENQAVDQYVPVFDSFVSQLVAAYNSKQISAGDAAMAAQKFDQSLYNTFRSFTGQPGTSWNDSTGMAGKCDKSCTVGCCVYFGDLGPVLNNISYVLGFPTGKWGSGDPRISGRTITVPKVYPSKYSSYQRALYSITLN